MRNNVRGTKHLILIFQEDQFRTSYAIVKYTTQMKQLRHKHLSIPLLLLQQALN